MNIRIYNATTHDGFILDTTGEHFLYFTSDKKEFLRLYQEADCLILDYEHFEYLNKVGVLPATKKFVVVLSEETAPKGLDGVWFTNLDVKQIKREIKIQGFDNVLCLVNDATAKSMVSSKVATEVTVAIYHTEESLDGIKIEILSILGKKIIPTSIKGKNFERLNYILKK